MVKTLMAGCFIHCQNEKSSTEASVIIPFTVVAKIIRTHGVFKRSCCFCGIGF